MTTSPVVFFPIKTCPPSNEQNGWINRANPCVECERIRFGEVGAGNSKYLQPEAVRKTRKDQMRVKGNAFGRQSASRWRLRGRAQSPLQQPKPRSPDRIQCHCPSAGCDPRSRMFQRHGRRDKPLKGTTRRIEEFVAALYPLMPFPRSACEKTHVARPTILPLRA